MLLFYIDLLSPCFTWNHPTVTIITVTIISVTIIIVTITTVTITSINITTVCLYVPCSCNLFQGLSLALRLWINQAADCWPDQKGSRPSAGSTRQQIVEMAPHSPLPFLNKLFNIVSKKIYAKLILVDIGASIRIGREI